MKKIIYGILFISLAFALGQNAQSQGFVNLSFEAANISGYSPGSTSVPITNAFPGWTATFSLAGYDSVPLGSPGISVVDSLSPIPQLQGNYSAYLFGANGISSGLSQTGLVPVNTLSLQMHLTSFSDVNVMLGGQTINMIPLQSFTRYTLYGGDISAFAGQVAQLNIIVSPPFINPGGLNPIELDSILFSPSAVPEPNAIALMGIGTLLSGIYCRRSSRCK